MAPFVSGGGYSSEAVAFAMALSQSPAIQQDKLWISQHGDGISKEVMQVLVAVPHHDRMLAGISALQSQ